MKSKMHSVTLMSAGLMALASFMVSAKPVQATEWLANLQSQPVQAAVAQTDFSIEQRGVQRALATQRLIIGKSLLDRSRLDGFYKQIAYKPIWTQRGVLTQAGFDMVGILLTAYKQGLNSRDYHAPLLRKLLEEPTKYPLELELIISDATMRYLKDLHGGRVDPELLSGELYISRYPMKPELAMMRLVNAPDVQNAVNSFQPEHPHYDLMRKALDRYLGLKQKGGWGRVEDAGLLHPNAVSPIVPALRERLSQEGYRVQQPEAGMQLVYDQSLVKAVKTFQKYHGLNSDGIIGEQTYEMLNWSVDRKIAAIRMNMERLRWLPWQLGNKYVWVNVPAYHLRAVQHGEIVTEMGVIVGRKSRQTPIFSDRIRYLELNPSWNVPKSIARKDFLPKLQNDPAFLWEDGFVVTDGWGADAIEIDWWQVNWGALEPEDMDFFRFRQNPGPTNALGSVKFMFPNDFDVYLHDTPQTGKFMRDARTFSSGCVRVAKPWELTRFLLPEEDGFVEDEWQAMREFGETEILRLRESVPVYLAYQTVEVSAAGFPIFYQDIYNHDVKLAEALAALGERSVIAQR